MRKLTLTLFSTYLALLLAVSILASGCEPGGDLTIVNRHSQEVRIFKSHVRNDGTTDEATYQITISANETRKFSITFIGSEWIKRIEAIDSSGKTVFLHDYNRADLEKIGWKIVIPPENGIESSDNVTGK